jgi:alpha-tubulin suppressor-like RCC1 family protein
MQNKKIFRKISTALMLLASFVMYSNPAQSATPAPTPTPAYPPSPLAFSDAAAGASHFVALDKQGRLWTWGDNTFGQLGLGNDNEIKALANDTPIRRSLPVLVGSGYRAIAAAWSYTLAIKTDGTLWGWGMHVPGLDSRQTYYWPTLISRIPLVQVYAGGDYALGLDANHVLWEFGRLGQPEDKGEMPSYILRDVKTVSANHRHAAIVLTDNTPWVFGRDNWNGILSKAPQEYRVTSQVGGDDRTATDTGLYFTQFKRQNGSAVYFGDMSYLKPYLGKIISEDKVQMQSESPYKTILNFNRLYNGERSVYLLKDNGDLDAVKVTFTDGKASTQPPVTIAASFQAIFGQVDHFIGLKTDGSLWTWGQGDTSLGVAPEVTRSDVPLHVTSFKSE